MINKTEAGRYRVRVKVRGRVVADQTLAATAGRSVGAAAARPHRQLRLGRSRPRPGNPR